MEDYFPGQRIIEVMCQHPSVREYFVIRTTNRTYRKNLEQSGYYCPFCPDGFIFPIRMRHCSSCKAVVTELYDAKTLKKIRVSPTEVNL